MLHDKDLCIGCGYCLYACPFVRPSSQQNAFGERGKMDKCTFCAGGPAETKEEEYEKYGANRIDEGKLPLCAEMCSTKALMAGDAQKWPTSSASVWFSVVIRTVPGQVTLQSAPSDGSTSPMTRPSKE